MKNMKISMDDLVGRKLYLAYEIFREANRSKSTISSLEKALGLTHDWVNGRVRYIKGNIEDAISLENDFMTSFMAEYSKYYQQDFSNSDTLNDLSKLYQHLTGIDSNEFFFYLNSKKYSFFNGDLVVIENFEQLLNFKKYLDGLDNIKTISIKVPDNVPANIEEASTDTAIFKDSELTKAVGSQDMVRDVVAEFVKEAGINGGKMTNASVWDRGNGEVNVAVKFDYTKKDGKPNDADEYEKINERLIDKLIERGNLSWPTYYNGNLGEKLGVYCLMDAHFGKLCIDRRSGDKYNLDIAEKRWMEAIEKHTQTLKANGIGKAIIIIGNDLFNTDNGKTTTAGTPQDEETFYELVKERVDKVVFDSCEYIAEHFPLEVITVRGNHDNTQIGEITTRLKYYFENPRCPHPRITVNKTIKGNEERCYYEFGRTLLCFHHGEMKRKMSVEAMNFEIEKLYQNRSYGYFTKKEIIVGHLHQEMMKDDLTSMNGITYRVMPSISGIDNWHHKNGYLNTPYSACLIYSDDSVLYCKLESKIKE